MTERHDDRLSDQAAWDDPSGDLMIDLISFGGHISWANGTQAEMLGMTQAKMTGLAVEACYSANAAQALRDLLTRSVPEGFVITLELELIDLGGRSIRTIGRCRKVTRGGEPHFRITKVDLGHIGQARDEMRAENRLFSRIIESASEAHWCIEFMEPVDLSSATESIIDQVFQNRSIWRIANPAMQALYHLPGSGAFRSFDVRLYWPRTAENEAFVRQIIDSDYRVDAAISSDRRYDGAVIKLENDVRADIHDGSLYRIWGNCRNVSGRLPAEATSGLIGVFAGFPDPVLILDENGAELARNEACTEMFAAGLPGPATLQRILAHAARGKARRAWSIPVAGSGKRSFIATPHKARDEMHRPVSILLLQPDMAPH